MILLRTDFKISFSHFYKFSTQRIEVFGGILLTDQLFFKKDQFYQGSP